ncbi:collagen-like protein [Rasiella rasia]|uniref:Collagen-like protein n=1 Tax=Rasiella rasia TaxID=2744027 RepID=A0A6G6GJ38_9FLAO|nr:collagen-like protein [Rasiella rasia]QIE58537.1 collagen-like protein [Rasiella rasia]
MKYLLLCLAITSSMFFTACEGDPGPPGPQGDPGINILGQVFEVTVDFQYNPDTALQEALINIPTSVEVYESDVILVYRLEKVVNASGGSADAWSPLPQNFFLGGGDIIQYVYNHTFFDVELLIDGNFDLSVLSTDFTNDQVFRIAVVPSEFATDGMSMTDLLETLTIDAADIETIGN